MSDYRISFQEAVDTLKSGSDLNLIHDLEEAQRILVDVEEELSHINADKSAHNEGELLVWLADRMRTASALVEGAEPYNEHYPEVLDHL